MSVTSLFHRHRAGSLLRCSKTTACLSTTSRLANSLDSILIANRGEIALRVGKTASEHGVTVTTIYTDPDAHAQHALSSPHALNIGETSAYLNGDKIIELAKKHGCKGIHPGYGFLSENPSFARKCSQAGLIFIGPPFQAIEDMGDKSRSKEIMTAAHVPCVPGYHGSNQGPDFLEQEARKIGFPVLIKAVRGGGGKGMRIAKTQSEFQQQLVSAKSEAMNSFGDEQMLVEKYITTPRHIEVQVFADKHGNCLALGERDCSIQRRHQKILEESPAPHLPEATRQDLWGKARAAALAVGYQGAGTVEFIFDNDTGEFFFMEMNTRLQVEHPVTEMVTGLDLVHWQLLVAEGGRLPLTQDEVEARIASRGHAIEARIYAENPEAGFIPDSGYLLHVKTPTSTEDVRIDAGFIAGDEVSSHYDPMISKLIVRAPTREEAVRKLDHALREYQIAGPSTNIEFIQRVCREQDFLAGEVETGFIEKHRDSLFAKKPLEREVLAQAALSSLFLDQNLAPFASVGFGGASEARMFHFEGLPRPGEPIGEELSAVCIKQQTPNRFDIEVDGQVFSNVLSKYDPASKFLTSFFPHTRLDTTVVRDGASLTLFQQGTQHRLRIPRPKWMDKALGIKSIANSVLAPMPCKILRVEVQEGDSVQKDQPLLVIESMKMETVIRSPHDGVIARLLHHPGDYTAAQTPLVEFVRSESEDQR